MLLLQLLFTYLPAMNTAFHSAPISLEAWMRITAAGLLVTLVIGGEKRFYRWRTNRNMA
jgi:Ca2+-transporting ATPase